MESLRPQRRSFDLLELPAQDILAIAESRSVDLIAMSTHGRGGLERWVMGSVMERVLGATRLPMLIVRPQNNG